MARKLADPGTVALHARNVAFDVTRTPLQWIARDAFASHIISAINFVLPEGERWFCETFNEALPLIQDEELRAAVRGFIGQEAMHAQAHDEVLGDLFRAQGIDTAPMEAVAERVFQQILGRRDLPDAAARHRHLVARLALIAGIENITALLGDWVLSAPLEEYGADPVVLDLFRWHGAEEVEHRMVAHDVAEYFGVGYGQRVGSLAIGYAGFLLLLVRVAHDLVRQDPDMADHHQARIWWELVRSGQRGTVPSIAKVTWSAVIALHPRFTPAWIGNTAQAVAYLAKSPAARAAT